MEKIQEELREAEKQLLAKDEAKDIEGGLCCCFEDADGGSS